MRLGIDPKIDYAFKRLFGVEKNKGLLIHLLNAVLQLPPGEEIVDVEILNPFNEKEAFDDKLSVLDIKARDQLGRQYNVEMQMLGREHFPQRIVYYGTRLHSQQLQEGDPYQKLRPTISVCFLNATLFPDVAEHHQRFRLHDPRTGKTFTHDLEVHLVELPKFQDSLASLSDELDRWLYFLKGAADLEPDALPEALDTPAIRITVKELQMLTQDELERERYEARVKFHRDAISLLEEVKVAQEGLRTAREELRTAREEARTEREELRTERERARQGREQGFQEGRYEGLDRGEWIGAIHLCQRRLKEPLTPREELSPLPLRELQRLAESLEQRLFSGSNGA